MFKKKSIYIIGIVVFTFILIADLAIYFMVPSGGNMGNRPNFDGESFSGEMPDGFSKPENGEMPSDFDSENFDSENFSRPQNGEMPDGFSKPENGEMPSDFDSENFNPEDFDGEVPEVFSRPESGEMPEDFDGSDFRGGGRGNSGALSTIKKAFIPILIICILGDGACIFMLIRLSKKKEDNDGGDGGLNDIPLNTEKSDDSTPQRDKTNTRLAVIAVILVLAVTVSSLSSGNSGGEMEAEKSILQQEATLNDISSVFSGSGTLQSSAAEETEIPASVTVNSYTVKNGDYVKKGDVIAKVNKQSVLNAVYEVQKLIDEMDEEIAEVKNNTLDSTITARAEGRVKTVYAKEGDSVADVMYDNGALLIISLGGSMSVEFTSKKSVKPGQTLSVKLPDGEKIEGKVQQIKNGKITVTVTDDGPTPNETVTVYTTDGTKLGKGKLEVSSPLKVTGIAGTVDDIYVKAGDEVNIGDTLMTLKNAKDEARYRQLLREREGLTKLVSGLSEMYKSGEIKAEQSGVVSLLSNDIGYTEQASEAETKTTNVGLNYSSEAKSDTLKLSVASSKTAKAVFLSSETSSERETTFPENESTESASESTTFAEEKSTEPSTEPIQPSSEFTEPDNQSTQPSTQPTEPDAQPTQPSTQPSQENESGIYAGVVLQITYNGLQVKVSEANMNGAKITDLKTMNEALFTSQKIFMPDSGVTVYMYKADKAIKSSLSAIQSGDRVFLHIENGKLTQIDFIVGTQSDNEPQGTAPEGTFPNGEIPEGTAPDNIAPGGTNSDGSYQEGTFPGGSSSGGMTNGGFSGGNMQMPSGGSAGFNSQQTATEEEEEATYVVEKFSLYAITPSETMEIDVNVDELDVLSLKTGQTANVTLDALPGQSMTGTVKKISPIGSTEDGGSTKYTATISVSRTEEMLDGMNASVKIEVNSLKSVLTIPAAAVYEDGNRTYVYLDANIKDDKLTDSVDITTGLSDGTNVEVLSGLSEGDTVYYSYADSIVYRTGR